VDRPAPQWLTVIPRRRSCPAHSLPRPATGHIPLVTVVLAVQGVPAPAAILARAGYVTLFHGIEIYVTILAYGAASITACSLRPATRRSWTGCSPGEAIAASISGVGGALVASMATVACGIAMDAIRGFGKFREAGFAIPLSLCWCWRHLTFSPALLLLAGRAFWPHHKSGRPPRPATRLASGRPLVVLACRGTGVFVGPVGRALVRRPGAIWLDVGGHPGALRRRSHPDVQR